MKRHSGSDFPSYKKIYQKLHKQKRSSLEDQLNRISNNIKVLKSSNTRKEHASIEKNLINFHKKSNVQGYPAHKQFQNLYVSQRKHIPTSQVSLNELLDSDSKSRHYKDHLRFRKTALEREIYQSSRAIGKITTKKGHKTVEEDEEAVFKNLYKNLESKGFTENDFDIQLQDAQRNKKQLKQTYGKYLSEMSLINIVKWRILQD